MHWKKIETIGTEKSNSGMGTNYYFNKFKFISNEMGVFLGEYKDADKIGDYKAVNIDKNKDAIILRTIDGGYHWQENTLGKGEMIDFNKVGDDFMALRKSYHSKEADEIISHIHVSKNQGKSWQEISQNENDAIDEIHFWTVNKGIGICGQKGYKYDAIKILQTEDTGKIWKEIKLPKQHQAMDFALTSQGILYYLTKERSSYIKVNLNTLQTEEINLFTDYELPFSIVLDNNENLYFVVENKDKRTMLRKRNNENSYTTIEFPFKDKMVFDVHIYDNTISMINEDKLYFISHDEGKTWTQENMGASYIRDVAFYGKGYVWVRTFPGQMIVRVP